MIKISKGLDLPISGTPIYEVEEQLVRSIGILGSDYPNLKPKMHVNIGDTVRAGDTLFEDSTNSIKKNPSINEIKYAPLSPDINFPKKLNKKTIERMHIKTLKL